MKISPCLPLMGYRNCDRECLHLEIILHTISSSVQTNLPIHNPKLIFSFINAERMKKKGLTSTVLDPRKQRIEAITLRHFIWCVMHHTFCSWFLSPNIDNLAQCSIGRSLTHDINRRSKIRRTSLFIRNNIISFSTVSVIERMHFLLTAAALVNAVRSLQRYHLQKSW